MGTKWPSLQFDKPGSSNCRIIDENKYFVLIIVINIIVLLFSIKCKAFADLRKKLTVSFTIVVLRYINFLHNFNKGTFETANQNFVKILT